MIRTVFDKLTRNFIEKKVLKTMATKRGEYSKDDDVFANFNKSAHFFMKDRVYAAWAFMVKHITSFMDICLGEKKREDITKELVDEKCQDLINYILLIRGMLYEENGWNDDED